MADARTLERTLSSIDGRGFASYKQIAGRYDLGEVELTIDRVQVDPFAPPSLVRVSIDRPTASLPQELLNDRVGRVAVTDFLTRAVDRAIGRLIPSSSGTGNSGTVSIGTPGQQVLERTSVVITNDRVEARLAVGLPASGRKARGHQAARLLTDLLPRIAEQSLRHRNLDATALQEHVTLYRDQEYLRSQLAEAGLVAFVGDGAILPRRSGDSDLPLGEDPIAFTSPESLRISFELPSGRTQTGMGVPQGVTVIVGGGYHGKSTLLRGIERGVYGHIGGDGREWVITQSDATSIRAEDGRAATGVDISAFIGNLPSGVDTTSFSTTNASGSTSQATNLVEALEAGVNALLIDEDTSATNFMIRDDRMRQLIPAEKEPITPFVDRVRPLFTDHGVSTVLVAGGSGAFFDVADHVIALDEYTPRNVTQQAQALTGEQPGPDSRGAELLTPGKAQHASQAGPVPRELDSDTAESDVTGVAFRLPGSRVLDQGSLHPTSKTKPASAKGRTTIRFGREAIELSAVSQLVDLAQTQALAHALDRLADEADGVRPLRDLVAALQDRVDSQGLDVLSPHRGHPGQLARPRAQEIHAAINRYRGLRILRQ